MHDVQNPSKHSKKKRLGNTRVEVSALGFGSSAIGDKSSDISMDNVMEAVERAFMSGISYFDTAPLYGLGLSEQRLGRALAGRKGNDFVISTKVGRILRPQPSSLDSDMATVDPIFDYSHQGVLQSVEASLDRIGLERINILLIHDVSPRWHGKNTDERFSEALDGSYAALKELRDAGKLSAIRVGINDTEICMRFAQHCDLDCFMLAARYTLLDQSALEEMLPLCLEKHISVLIAAPFNSGILATGPIPGAQYAYKDPPLEILERTRKLVSVCRKYKISLAAAALQFPSFHPAVASVVVGVKSAAELSQNILSFNCSIPCAFWEELKDRQLLPPQAPTPSC